MLWFSRWRLGTDSLNSEDLIPVTQPHVIGKSQDGSRSRAESQFTLSWVSWWVTWMVYVSSSDIQECCEAWQGKGAPPIPAGGKVLPTFTAAQPCLHGWLLLWWGERIVFLQSGMSWLQSTSKFLWQGKRSLPFNLPGPEGLCMSDFLPDGKQKIGVNSYIS